MGEFSPPPFSEPPTFFFLFFSYHLSQALVLLHYYKNSPPISKSCIYAWLLHLRVITQVRDTCSNHVVILETKCDAVLPLSKIHTDTINK